MFSFVLKAGCSNLRVANTFSVKTNFGSVTTFCQKNVMKSRNFSNNSTTTNEIFQGKKIDVKEQNVRKKVSKVWS